MRLWTWQAPEVASTLCSGGDHRGDWERVAPAGRTAYSAMVARMGRAGIPDVGSPPVWVWCDEPTAETVADRAFHVVRDDDVARGLVVVVVDAPPELVLLTSYSGWCDHLADPLSARSLRPNRRLGRADVQGCLPFVRAQWVLDALPVPADSFLLTC